MLLLLSITSKVFANAENEMAAEGLPHVSITPQLCIIKSDDERCRTEVAIHWENVSGVVCIEADSDSFHAWCASSTEQQSHTFTLDTDTDVHFVLKDKASGQLLAGIDFKTTLVAKQPLRRRYRNPWSLF
ncbi:DUF3019 domain-containing protein [Shewanella mangrovi]|uniref:DUF3019 domain-containing protein n=1 Tax=Shewanella mangrovi TaxID=1515746 RepID=UPI000A768B5D|nr:DUF3019 domain-containing protein [Shewanella mangrovi]